MTDFLFNSHDDVKKKVKCLRQGSVHVVEECLAKFVADDILFFLKKINFDFSLQSSAFDLFSLFSRHCIQVRSRYFLGYF